MSFDDNGANIPESLRDRFVFEAEKSLNLVSSNDCDAESLLDSLSRLRLFIFHLQEKILKSSLGDDNDHLTHYLISRIHQAPLGHSHDALFHASKALNLSLSHGKRDPDIIANYFRVAASQGEFEDIKKRLIELEKSKPLTEKSFEFLLSYIEGDSNKAAFGSLK